MSSYQNCQHFEDGVTAESCCQAPLSIDSQCDTLVSEEANVLRDDGQATLIHSTCLGIATGQLLANIASDWRKFRKYTNSKFVSLLIVYGCWIEQWRFSNCKNLETRRKSLWHCRSSSSFQCGWPWCRCERMANLLPHHSVTISISETKSPGKPGEQHFPCQKISGETSTRREVGLGSLQHLTTKKSK